MTANSVIEHIPPCSDRFSQRVFSHDYDYRNLCRCCGRLMGGRKLFHNEPDPLCARCDRLQNQHVRGLNAEEEKK